MGFEVAEFVDNPEPRCPVALVLDTSKSMTGERIEELNAGVATFKEEVMRDELAAVRVEVAMITFGGRVMVPQAFVTVDRFEPPELTAGGKTPLGGAVEIALDLVEQRKTVYREHGIPYYRPWVFLITDGAPTDGELWRRAAERVQAAEAERRISFFAVGVEGADFDLLGQITPPSRPPLMLQRLRFRDLFEWLSVSVRRVSTSAVGADSIPLPAVDGWSQLPP